MHRSGRASPRRRVSAVGSRLAYGLQTLLASLVIVVAIVGWTSIGGNQQPLHNDTDDAMRMVTAMDLLAGQPWQDLTAHRDNTPFGGDLHWSRLVDAPIAALTALLGPNNAAVVWPLLLVLPLLALTRIVVAQLVPDAGLGTVTALMATNLLLYTEFVPGRVDHHNVQIVLVEGLLAALLVGRRTAWGGALAGLLIATCFAIGLETIVIVVAASVGMALCWLAAPLDHRRGLLGFAAGIGGGAIAHFLIATAPDRYFVAACDVLSIVYVTALVLAALTLAGSALFASDVKPGIRLAVLLAGGCLAIGITALLFPACLGGPYANVDPRVIARQFSEIPEVTSLWRLAERAGIGSTLFIGAMMMAGTIVIALLVMIWRSVRLSGEARRDWLIALLMLVAAFAVMTLQIRGWRLASMLALPAGAWLIVSVRQNIRPPGLQATALVLAWLVSASFVQFIVAALVAPAPAADVAATGPSIAECRREGAYAALAALPAGGVAAPVLISPHILRYTPHSVLSAGFHRNGQSIIDSLDFFEGNEVRARQIVAERGLAYVVTCGVDATIDSWSWLRRLPSPGPLQLYEVVVRFQ